MSVPLPALTVTGGSVVAGGVEAGGGVSWARASAGIRARPASAARVAARMESMKSTPRRTNERDALASAPRFQLSDEERWPAGLAWPVANADGGGLLGRQQRRRDGGDTFDEDKDR